MNNIKNLVLGGIAALVLGGCASLPVATYTTSNGCGIAQWNQQWVQLNVESMSWTGSCESGLAQGNGTLLVKLKNGKQREYVGAMDKGFIHGDGTYTKESGWKYQGHFLWLTFTNGRIYTSEGHILFDGIMAHNEKYNGQNITFNDQRYHQGKLYFPDGSYIDDGRYTGSAGPALGIASIDPQTGKGIVYGKYMKDGQVIYRWAEGKLYQDDISYMQAQTRYYEKLNAALDVEIAAAKKVQAERSAKDRQETYALLGNAAAAAAGGTNAAERRQLALNALAGNEPSAAGSSSGARGASGSSSSGEAPKQESSQQYNSTAGGGGLSPQQIAACTEDIKRKQIESQSWGGNVNDTANRLGRYQKDLFEGRCAGHPEARAYIAGANKMLGYRQEGSASTPASAGRPTNGGNSTGSTNSEVRDYPEPDRNGCLRIVENTRGKQCGSPSSALVRIKNTCAEKIHMQLCLWDSKRSQWSCGAGTGRAGEKYLDDVLQYVCESNGRYLYSGCSEQAEQGRFRNGNCGGNPNTQGKHSLLPN